MLLLTCWCSLRTKFGSPGHDAAITQECQHEVENVLGIFPFTTLVRAGRQLIAARRAECNALKSIAQVHHMLEKDLEVNDSCLHSSGDHSKEKDAAVQKLRNAREHHQSAQSAFDMLSLAMNVGNQHMIKIVWQGLGLQGVPTLKKIRVDARKTLNDLTSQIFQLTGEIQRHFPEVILFVGHGLPPDLRLLWWPSQSLDSFHEKKLVQSESRHKVWQVQKD